MAENISEYDAELQALVAQSQETSGTAGWEVNKAMIQQWVEAFEDGNAMYTDEEYAKKSKYGGIIAPPPMTSTFSGGPRWPVRETARQAAPGANKLTEMLHAEGYTQTVATNNAWEFYRPIQPGDRLTSKGKTSSITTRKQTRTGEGYFMTNDSIYYNQRGEMVAKQSFTTLRFKAPERKKE